jgi:hypothetical protein
MSLMHTPTGQTCDYLSAVPSNATHLVDGVNGKLYVWNATNQALPSAKTLCAAFTPDVPGVSWGAGLVITYNTFEENMLVENYFRAQQGAKSYHLG